MTFSANAAIVSIFVSHAKGAPLIGIEAGELVAGRGLVGDKRFSLATKAKSQLSLIEEEALVAAMAEAGVDVPPWSSRRNIITRGVALNHLVGREFVVGGALVRGMELCEPCGHLAKVVSAAFSKALVHRGGLRCEIVRSGGISVGAAIAASS